MIIRKYITIKHRKAKRKGSKPSQPLVPELPYPDKSQLIQMLIRERSVSINYVNRKDSSKSIIHNYTIIKIYHQSEINPLLFHIMIIPISQLQTHLRDKKRKY